MPTRDEIRARLLPELQTYVAQVLDTVEPGHTDTIMWRIKARADELATGSESKPGVLCVPRMSGDTMMVTDGSWIAWDYDDDGQPVIVSYADLGQRDVIGEVIKAGGEPLRVLREALQRRIDEG